jgi:ABC-type nitrate/sulfonate/bicarbonate transport system permease component
MTISSLIQLVLGFVYPLVVGIPLLALLGMVEAGKEVIERY